MDQSELIDNSDINKKIEEVTEKIKARESIARSSGSSLWNTSIVSGEENK